MCVILVFIAYNNTGTCGVIFAHFFQTPNPAASEFIPKGAPRMATMAQSSPVQAFPLPLCPHPGLSSSTAAALAPGVFFFLKLELLRSHVSFALFST